MLFTAKNKFKDKLHLTIVSNILYLEGKLKYLDLSIYHFKRSGVVSELGVYYGLLMKFYSKNKKNNYLTIKSKLNMDFVNHENRKILALTWKQPFASLMLNGKIETRSWNTNYRGLVLICAGKTVYNEQQLLDISGEVQTQRIFNYLNFRNMKELKGKAIAIGFLIDCRPMQPEDENNCFVKYRPGLYCHIYKNVKAIKPLDWKGKQGWKNVPEDIINQFEYI